MTTRLLKAKDVFIAYYMDELSGFNIASYIDDENDWAWGLFDKDEHLIGYCTIGCADDCCDAITKHPMYNSESLLLDNVFILPEYRDTNNAIRMICRHNIFTIAHSKVCCGHSFLSQCFLSHLRCVHRIVRDCFQRSRITAGI